MSTRNKVPKRRTETRITVYQGYRYGTKYSTRYHLVLIIQSAHYRYRLRHYIPIVSLLERALHIAQESKRTELTESVFPYRWTRERKRVSSTDQFFCKRKMWSHNGPISRCLKVAAFIVIMQLSVLISGVEGDVPPEDDAIFEQPSENPCHDLVLVLDRWKSILEYTEHNTQEERCNDALDEARAFCCENLSIAIRNLDFGPTDFQSIPQHLDPEALKSGICRVNNDDNQEVLRCDKNKDRMNQQRCNYALDEARAFCCENLSIAIRNLDFGPTDFQITLILIFIVVGAATFLVFALLRLMELIDDYWFSWKKYQHSN